MTQPYPFVPHCPPRLPEAACLAAGREFLARMDARRSVRHFSADPVPREAIELAIAAASTAPSGAHMQPWTFVAIDDAEIKRRIREAAEQEERTSYTERMSEQWLRALAPLGTDWHKPYLETAPYLVVVFEQTTGVDADGLARKHYYVKESVGIACGLFIAALQHMGLCTLTHTPNPMGFLSQILGRPRHEKPYILFPVGYAAADATVPDLQRKPLDTVRLWNPR
ncbi:MAG: nitroreductase family protein [Nannocystaceae bacterium]